MKNILFVLVMLAGLSANGQKHVPIFLLGQSNADGRLDSVDYNVENYFQATTTLGYDDEINQIVPLDPGNNFSVAVKAGQEEMTGIDIFFGKMLEQHDQDSLEYVVWKCTRGGTALVPYASSIFWFGGGSDLKLMIDTMYTRYTNSEIFWPASVAIWCQGEAEAGDTEANSLQWEADFNSMLSDLRAALGYDIPVIIIGTNPNIPIGSYPYINNIVTAQKNIAATAKDVYYLDTEPSNFTLSGDQLHYDYGGYLEISKYIMDMYINHVKPRILINTFKIE